MPKIKKKIKNKDKKENKLQRIYTYYIYIYWILKLKRDYADGFERGN